MNSKKISKTFEFPENLKSRYTGRIFDREERAYWDVWIDSDHGFPFLDNSRDAIDCVEDMTNEFSDEILLSIAWARVIWATNYCENINIYGVENFLFETAEVIECDISSSYKEENERIDYIKNLILKNDELMAVLEFTR